MGLIAAVNPARTFEQVNRDLRTNPLQATLDVMVPGYAQYKGYQNRGKTTVHTSSYGPHGHSNSIVTA